MEAIPRKTKLIMQKNALDKAIEEGVKIFTNLELKNIADENIREVYKKDIEALEKDIVEKLKRKKRGIVILLKNMEE